MKNSKKSLVNKIRKLADQMEKVAVEMEYYGGFGEIAEHGKELLNASKIARTWAAGIEFE